jgi:hypothetical protein
MSTFSAFFDVRHFGLWHWNVTPYADSLAGKPVFVRHPDTPWHHRNRATNFVAKDQNFFSQKYQYIYVAF